MAVCSWDMIHPRSYLDFLLIYSQGLSKFLVFLFFILLLLILDFGYDNIYIFFHMILTWVCVILKVCECEKSTYDLFYKGFGEFNYVCMS